MTRRGSLLSIVAVLLLFPSLSSGQKRTDGLVEVHNGFITGQSYRDLPEASKRSYVAGVVDGMFFAPGLGAPKEKVLWLETASLA